jgi:hypothetical protein
LVEYLCMESEEINKALHRYVIAVLRARDCAHDLALEQRKASQSETEPPRTIDAIPNGEDDTRPGRGRLPRHIGGPSD